MENIFENDDEIISEVESIGADCSGEVLESDKSLCSLCGYGELRDIGRKSDVILYTRNGSFKATSIEKRCNNYRCLSGHFYGFHRGHSNEKIMDSDVLQKKYLLTSNRTGFSIDYLWDIVLQILFSCASFESLANIYNNYHCSNLPMYILEEREEIC